MGKNQAYFTLTPSFFNAAFNCTVWSSLVHNTMIPWLKRERVIDIWQCSMHSKHLAGSTSKRGGWWWFTFMCFFRYMSSLFWAVPSILSASHSCIKYLSNISPKNTLKKSHVLGIKYFGTSFALEWCKGDSRDALWSWHVGIVVEIGNVPDGTRIFRGKFRFLAIAPRTKMSIPREIAHLDPKLWA